MRHLANGSVLIDELAIVLVFRHEDEPMLLLTSPSRDDAARVVQSMRPAFLGLLVQALELLGEPVVSDDISTPESDVEGADDL